VPWDAGQQSRRRARIPEIGAYLRERLFFYLLFFVGRLQCAPGAGRSPDARVRAALACAIAAEAGAQRYERQGLPIAIQHCGPARGPMSLPPPLAPSISDRSSRALDEAAGSSSRRRVEKPPAGRRTLTAPLCWCAAMMRGASGRHADRPALSISGMRISVQRGDFRDGDQVEVCLRPTISNLLSAAGPRRRRPILSQITCFLRPRRFRLFHSSQITKAIAATRAVLKLRLATQPTQPCCRRAPALDPAESLRHSPWPSTHRLSATYLFLWADRIPVARSPGDDPDGPVNLNTHANVLGNVGAVFEKVRVGEFLNTYFF